jgi:anti-sigma-K factor RskA
MTAGDRMSGTTGCSGDAAAYVLGAQDPAEAEAFRRHMDGCVVCRDEVTAFQQIADALPMAAPQHRVPGELRRRVFRAVRAEPRPARAAAPHQRHRPFSLLPRPAIAGGVALIAAAAIVGGAELSSSGSSGTRLIHASVFGSGGSAQLRLTGGRAELIVHHLPSPRRGRVYEVWLKRPHGPPAPTAALFSVTSSGTGDVGVPGSLHGISEVLVTEEPAGGSETPTEQPVIIARLS